MSASKSKIKLEVLKDIRESKDVLFASFSDTCTKEDKVKAWKAIHEKASALGVVPATKDFIYTRDTLWQNLKKKHNCKFLFNFIQQIQRMSHIPNYLCA